MMSQHTQFGPALTPMVKKLIMINCVIYLAQMVTSTVGSSGILTQFFALNPGLVFFEGFVWQIFTYQFLHGSLFHILFNMLALWMFGSELEKIWGSSEFLRFYLVSGIGAGLFIVCLPLLLGHSSATTLGASGAIFGLLLAYAVYYPERYLMFMFFFPIKVKYFVIIIGLFSLLLTVQEDNSSGISHVGHLGGLISGYLYILNVSSKRKQGYAASFSSSGGGLIERWQNYKKKRLWEKRQKEIEEFENMEEKIDALLEKISKYGMDSLTSNEKNFLKKASENLDGNGGDTFH